MRIRIVFVEEPAPAPRGWDCIEATVPEESVCEACNAPTLGQRLCGKCAECYERED